MVVLLIALFPAVSLEPQRAGVDNLLAIVKPPCMPHAILFNAEVRHIPRLRRMEEMKLSELPYCARTLCRILKRLIPVRLRIIRLSRLHALFLCMAYRANARQMMTKPPITGPYIHASVLSEFPAGFCFSDGRVQVCPGL